MRETYGWILLGGLGAAALMAACATGSDASTDVEDDGSSRSTTTSGGGEPGVGGALAGPTTGPGPGGNGPGPGGNGPGAGGSSDGGGGAPGVGGMGGAGAAGTGGLGGNGGAGNNGGNGGSGGSPIVCTPILLDPGFEAGTPSPVWTESSTFFTTPLCTTASCGGGAPLSGSWFYWGGGFVDVLFGGNEVAVVAQTLVIPVGTATLSWNITMPNCDTGVFAEDYFGFVIDGTTVYITDTLTDPSCGQSTYQLRSIDISGYANGAAHTIEIVTDQLFDPLFSTDVTNVYVDDVSVLSCQ